MPEDLKHGLFYNTSFDTAVANGTKDGGGGGGDSLLIMIVPWETTASLGATPAALGGDILGVGEVAAPLVVPLLGVPLGAPPVVTPQHPLRRGQGLLGPVRRPHSGSLCSITLPPLPFWRYSLYRAMQNPLPPCPTLATLMSKLVTAYISTWKSSR